MEGCKVKHGWRDECKIRGILFQYSKKGGSLLLPGRKGGVNLGTPEAGEPKTFLHRRKRKAEQTGQGNLDTCSTDGKAP